jgi:hypothetical protein
MAGEDVMETTTIQLWIALIAIIPATLASVVTLILAWNNKKVIDVVHKVVQENGKGSK